MTQQEIRVKGTVQGVGFRPTVYRLALECQLHGEVSNDCDGVLIRLSGMDVKIKEFLNRLNTEAPPLAKIESITHAVIEHAWDYRDFSIRASTHSAGRTDIAADAASCAQCLLEINDPNNRRYLYPFTNCTHCGPRLSIVNAIPYDRCHTSMHDFKLCAACEAEYRNPLDRRFHAQPTACHACGPRIFLSPSSLPTHIDPIQRTQSILDVIQQALVDGKIVAIKGLGGFHLCCDASNHASVEQLRQRKHRYAKPLALMTHDTAAIRAYCQISEQEEQYLRSPAAPIVLLNRQAQVDVNFPVLSTAIAPGSHLIGFMLAYTPLHHLICQRFGKALVMTSANLSGEPQITDDEEALEKLAKTSSNKAAIADLVLYHDRPIANRIDDSVVRCHTFGVQVLRRARGYAPRSIALHNSFQNADRILAYGAELKSTFCLIKQGGAILSQHQGDLEDVKTCDDYEKNLALFKILFEFSPTHLACDLHPEYISSKLAHAEAHSKNLHLLGIQHHHAHIASAMAENGLSRTHPKVLGIAFDGLGYGDNGELWGGEFLLADFCESHRVARLQPVALPGAAQAMLQPWRNTYAQIRNSMSWTEFRERYGTTKIAQFFEQQSLATVDRMLQAQVNCPLASSAGRLFDAVAAALDIHPDKVQFEGQAAITLESLVDQNYLTQLLRVDSTERCYQFEIQSDPTTQLYKLKYELSAAPMWPSLLDDLNQQHSQTQIATRFHAALIQAVLKTVDLLRTQYPFNDVVLSGGCMQNEVLSNALQNAIQERGLACITHHLVPANDGGIALGQAVIAAARTIKKIDIGHNE
ncbi:carbamoyltransferase HypF [Undibacterium sp. LX15W]|uniref:Carbamoyltransferase HypF n=1 Tax=Undibacterium flavidum TaxID=2762297 RepID=A0ABR6Y7Z9_9BURK|nr:carbamoyltransferase HypF [Undibacterium flavidum]